MKCVSLAVVLLCLFLPLSAPVQAQVSFFQPLTFSDCPYGPLFVADFNGDGKPDLLCAYGVLDLGNGDGTFKAGLSVPVSPPSGVSTVLAVADFNGDGKPDLLEEATNPSSFSVLLGNGDGTFQLPISTATGGILGFLAAADLNGDGRADVVGVYGAVLYVFISNGDGTFKPGVTYALGTPSTLTGTLSFGDFNGDGKKDIALNISASGNNGQVLVLLGNGDGTFQAPKTSTGAPYEYEPGKTVVGDFNGDGKPDLAVSDVCSGCSVPSYVYVQLGNGDGTFQPPTGTFPSPSPIGVSGTIATFGAADLNGDGRLDLVFYDAFSNNATPGGNFSLIYLGNGDGTFSAPSSYVSSFGGTSVSNPSDGSVAIADFNGDGKLDIASSGGILLGNGDGTFQGIPLATLSQEVSSAAMSDFEKNGKPDVAAVSNSYVYILHNNGSGVLSLLHNYSLTAPGFQILVGDLNGDGNLDLVVIQDGPAGYSVFLGNGDGSFQSPIFYAESASFGIATLVDINNDKKLDLIEAGTNVPVGVSLGNGDGTFATTVTYDALSPWGTTLITGDFSGHGKVDIGVSPPYQTPGTVMLYGNGDGTFQPSLIPVDLNSYMANTTADFRNIGRADLYNGQVALNNGDGTFTFLPAPKYGGYLGDINGDGKIDILIPNTNQGPSSCQTAVALGNGDGTFGTPFNVPPNGCLPFSVSPNGYANIADMNGDGKPDIIFLWGSAVGVLLNTSAPDFSIAAASGSPTSQTVTAGQTASFSLTFAPVGSFTGTINLSCAVTPVATPAPTCSLSSSSVQISGSGGQKVTVQVGTTAPVTSSAAPHPTFPAGPMPLTWALMFLASAWVGLRSRKRLPVFATPVIILAFIFLVGCGGGGSSSTTHTTPGTPAGTYTVTVTATSGSTSHNMALQVVVQ